MKTLNGTTFYGMIISAANSLDNKQELINNMNVFPVPDGDTGINMTLTMRTMKRLEGDDSLSACAKKAADIALRSARGNSGAILSLFFRGMAKAFRGYEEADAVASIVRGLLIGGGGGRGGGGGGIRRLLGLGRLSGLLLRRSGGGLLRGEKFIALRLPSFYNIHWK